MPKIPININDGTVKKEDVIVGIDLGTTNSLVAYIKDGQPYAVRDSSDEHAIVPSVIHFGEEESIIVGEEAKAYLTKHPSSTIYSVKRLMGRSHDDVKAFKSTIGYHIMDDDTDALVKIKVHDKYYTPIELSANILRALKARIEKELGATVSRAVITVPAYFNDTQRQATRDAGKLAGLDVLRIVNEPTAASLAYGLGMQKEKEETIAIYDLGGGTFDISILQIQEGIFEVLSTHGDTFLGGDDFDQAIVKFWTEKYSDQLATTENSKSKTQELRLLAEEAKKHLSTSDQFSIDFNGLQLSLTRAEFEEQIRNLVARTIQSCRKAMKDADITIADIDHVIVVGGSTRVPFIKNEVSKFFEKTVHDDLDPDEVVALGAAVQADILAGNNKDILLLDVTPLSLGIETVGGLMDTLIPRNNKIPTKVGRQYTTSVDGQQHLKVSIFQGERDMTADNRKLGQFILSGIPPMPAGIPKIEIQFLIDADGILTVKAKELRSGTETHITIQSTYGISEEEMAKMLIESIQHAEEDMKNRAVLESINEANNILLSADKFLIQNDAILSAEEKQKTKLHVETLTSAVQAREKDLIQKAIEDLNFYTTPLAHRALDANIGTVLKGKEL